MSTLVLSYSLTGNNDRLARAIAARLGAEHASIAEAGKRTMATIAADMMLGRTPRVNLPAAAAGEHELVVFVGPVWMGGVASPLRACFRELGPRLGRYAFVSVCGGADGANPKLAAELTRRLGKEPAAVVELLKADLLPPEPRPTRNDTMNYRVDDAELRRLTDKAVVALEQITA
jgi:hypothetical protein